MKNIIFNEDCVIGMEKIKDGSIDLLLTDPPYNVSMKSNFHTMGRVGVDFGEWDKGFDQQTWLRVALKKVKKGGSVFIFNDWKNIGEIKEVLEDNGFTLKELIQWKKTNPMPRNRDRLYVTSCEFAIWAVNGKGRTFNRQRDTYENAIFEYPLVPHKGRIHPTQKRLEVIQDIIKIHSNEGDLILDPFMGSATTAVACINTGRSYVGFETDTTYFELSTDRLNKGSAVHDGN